MNEFPFAIVGFDLDGTLLDTSADLGAALNHALLVAGRRPIQEEQVRDLIGGGGKQMLERALGLTGGLPDRDEFRALHGELLSYYEANIAVHSRLFPGGEAMLDALQVRGVSLAVVTNKLEHLAVKLLGELDLAGRFTTIIGGDTLGPGRAKPNPDPIQAMVGRCGGGSAAFVGDTTYDTRAARSAGVPCVGVRFGFNDVAADELGADTLIDHFDELVPALEALAEREAAA